ncbi:helix-turn-helix transcriptional regulator [Streptomyces sp. LS1784]|uniref:helix-turn-helix domain-containing protein n=1 Tax=Streptomyces sp. LS1784 TaxID=2851533 RepID=UPI001CCFD14D
MSRTLSHLQRSSGTTIRALSQAAGVSPSFVCRVLSGHKMPSWPITRAIAEACGTNPDDLRILWQTAHGARPRPPAIRRNDSELFAEALATLRSALRGLHLAAFSPPRPWSANGSTGPSARETSPASSARRRLPPPCPTGPSSARSSTPSTPMRTWRPLWEHAQVARDPYWTPERSTLRSVTCGAGPAPERRARDAGEHRPWSYATVSDIGPGVSTRSPRLSDHPGCGQSPPGY